MDTSDQATVTGPTRRLLRTNEEKQRIVAEAMVPGASVATVRAVARNDKKDKGGGGS